MTIPRRLAFVLVILVLSSRVVATQPVDVRVRLVYLKNGKPAKSQTVVLYLGDPQSGAESSEEITSTNGVAVFHVTEPLPKSVWVYEENGRITGCAWEDPIPLDDVMKQGVTIGVDAKIGGPCKGDRSVIRRLAAKPGEIVMFVRKLSFWEKMQN